MVLREAVFAGGCFWGIEKCFKDYFGNRIISATSGYCGGSVMNPTYKQVCTGNTGHAESVLVKYDDSVVKYKEISDAFFRMHDPTQKNRQGPDYGPQYRSSLLYKKDDERGELESALEEAKKHFKKDLATTIEKYTQFYPAEEYHQDYFNKNRFKMHACSVHRVRSWEEIESA